MKHEPEVRWIPIQVEMAFERKEMRTLRNGRWQYRTIVTPRIRLPDGSMIRGARVSEAIARRQEERGR